MKTPKENFDLRQLRAFHVVVRNGGFSKASQEIGLTQPTLSTHILNLERMLGVKLLDRSGRDVTPTPAGKVLAEYAARILELCQESVQAIEAFHGQIKGSVHIESSTVPGEYILPRWLGTFHNSYPEVQVTLTVNDSVKVLEKVMSGEVPFGITGMPGNHASLKSDLLCEDKILLVSRPDILPAAAKEKTSIHDMMNIPLIRREPGSGTRVAVEKALKKSGIASDRLNWTVTLGSTRAVIEGALSGLGAAFLSISTVTKEIKEGRLVALDLKEPRISRGFYIVYKSKTTISPVAGKLREELVKASQNLLLEYNQE